MNKFRKYAAGSAIAAGAVISSAGLALADGYAAPRAAAVAATDWSGVYFGLQSGYSWSTIDQRFITTDTASNDYSAATVGAHLGVQHQFGTIVIGLEGSMDFNYFEKDARSKSRLGINCGTASLIFPGALDVDCTARTNNILSVGARAGLAMGKYMPYITGGYASGQVETTRQTGILNPSTVVGPHVTIDQDGDRHDGWYLGGGVEWVVSPGWMMGLEYRHYEFDTTNHLAFCTGDASPAFPCGSLQGVAVPLNSSRVDASMDSIMARVSWKWGREPTAAPLK